MLHSRYLTAVLSRKKMSCQTPASGSFVSFSRECQWYYHCWKFFTIKNSTFKLEKNWIVISFVNINIKTNGTDKQVGIIKIARTIKLVEVY